MSLFNPPTPPTPQDPNAVAQTQQNYNVSAQAGSNYNQVNPYGSVSYVQSGTGPGGVPIYTANTQLSPEQQNLLKTLTGTQTTAGGAAGELLGGAGYGSVSPGQAIGNISSGIAQPIIAQEQNYLKPTFDAQTEQLDTQLRNQGMIPGEPGYDNAMRGLSQNQDQAMSGFVASVAPTAEQEATQIYQMPMTMAESLGQFGGPSNPLSMMAPTNTLQPANYTGAVATAEQMQEQNYAQQVAQQNAMMSGLFSIPSAALGGWAKGGFQMPGASASTGGGGSFG